MDISRTVLQCKNTFVKSDDSRLMQVEENDFISCFVTSSLYLHVHKPKPRV